jgi:hypothetical protein
MPTASLIREPLASQYLMGKRKRADAEVSGLRVEVETNLSWTDFSCLPERLLGQGANEHVGERRGAAATPWSASSSCRNFGWMGIGPIKIVEAQQA